MLRLTDRIPGLEIPPGALFYPCCGHDLREPVDLFGNVLDEFHFADILMVPGFPDFPVWGAREKQDAWTPDGQRGEFLFADSRTSCMSSEFVDCPVAESSVRKIKHRRPENFYGEHRYSRRALRYSQCWTCGDDPDVETLSTHRYMRDGLSLFLEIGKISVFFLRGDSLGEGGSGQMWYQPKLFDLILSKLKSGGLIVTDGSGRPDWEFNDDFPWSFIWRDYWHQNDYPEEFPDDFEYSGRRFKCLHRLVRRTRYSVGPVYVWQVYKMKH